MDDDEYDPWFDEDFDDDEDYFEPELDAEYRDMNY